MNDECYAAVPAIPCVSVKSVQFGSAARHCTPSMDWRGNWKIKGEAALGLIQF